MIKSECWLIKWFHVKIHDFRYFHKIYQKVPIFFFFLFFFLSFFCVVSFGFEAKSAQCGIMRSFLSLRFYVKSIFGDLSSSKPAILVNHLTTQIFEFLVISVIYDISKYETFTKIKIQKLQNCSNSSFWPFKISQNWFHVKSD